MKNFPNITRHGRRRAKQRAGLCLRALKRTAAAALAEGLTAADTRGALRRYLEGKAAAHEGAEPRVHGLHVFIFGRDDTLITVWELPHEYRRSVADARRKKAC